MKISLLLIIVFTLAGCSTLSKDKIPLLNLYSFQEVKTDTIFKGVPFGGLSGIVFDLEKNVFYAISDDRSDYGPARVYVLNLEEVKPLRFVIKDQILLTDQFGKHYTKSSVDFEGIALLPNGNILLSSESIERKEGNIPPRLMEFSREGKFIKRWAVPAKYRHQTDFGVRENKSFESLFYNKNKVYTAVENALIEDGPEPGFKQESNLRVLRYTAQGDHYTPCKEFVYRLSALPVDSDKQEADMGLVELLPYKNGFLALERSYIYTLHKNVIKLFYFVEGDNVSLKDNLKRYQSKTVKTLILDFDSLGIKLDNIEGMTWGPKLKNGNQSLIFVSDNNFNKKQRTLFLLFEVVP